MVGGSVRRSLNQRILSYFLLITLDRGFAKLSKLFSVGIIDAERAWSDSK
jgi:hypothetical protein